MVRTQKSNHPTTRIGGLGEGVRGRFLCYRPRGSAKRHHNVLLEILLIVCNMLIINNNWNMKMKKETNWKQKIKKQKMKAPA